VFSSIGAQRAELVPTTPPALPASGELPTSQAAPRPVAASAAAPPRIRWFTLAAAGLMALACLTLVFTLVRPWTPPLGIFTGGLDLAIYRDAGLRVWEEAPIYATPFYGLWYTYTPFSTLVFLPLQAIPDEYLPRTGTAATAVMLVAVVWLSFRMLGYRPSWRVGFLSVAVAAAALFLEPVRTTVFYGQINVLLMLIVLWDASRPAGSRFKGVGVGLTAAIKLTPTFFAAYYMVIGRFRAAAVAVGVFAGSIAAAWVCLPADSRTYWTATFFDSARIAPDGMPANQSIRGALAHLLGAATPAWLWLLLAIPTAIATLAVSAAAHRRGERLLAVTAAGLGACVVSPFTWSHHWVWLVPLLAYVVHRANMNRAWWLAVVAMFAGFGAWVYNWNPEMPVVGWFLFPPAWPITPVVLMNLYVLLYYVGLAALAVGLLRRSGRAARASATSRASLADVETV
jgi:alpha-1,2-mannosyltransferase